jgi:photosystem II stability/assembly factor-like uncharacterized protein
VPALDNPARTDSVKEGFSFVDAQHGWALGNGQFLITQDGGVTWRRVRMYEEVAEPKQPMKLFMFDLQRGIAVGGLRVAQTVNGGVKWDVVPNSPELHDVRCTRGGFCIGWSWPEVRAAYFSYDFGQTWQQTDPLLDPEKDDVHDVQLVGTNGAVIVGRHTPQKVFSLRNWDLRTPLPTPPPRVPPRALLLRWNGTTWQRTEYPDIENLWTVHFVDQTNVWASADTNGILHSTDGAQTWTFVPDYYRQIAALTPTRPPFVPPTRVPTP